MHYDSTNGLNFQISRTVFVAETFFQGGLWHSDGFRFFDLDIDEFRRCRTHATNREQHWNQQRSSQIISPQCKNLHKGQGITSCNCLHLCTSLITQIPLTCFNSVFGMSSTLTCTKLQTEIYLVLFGHERTDDTSMQHWRDEVPAGDALDSTSSSCPRSSASFQRRKRACHYNGTWHVYLS